MENKELSFGYMKGAREIEWASDVPSDVSIYIYGSGRGGEIVLAALQGAGRKVVGFIDSFRSGEAGGLPLLTRDAFLSELRTDCAVVIASERHQEIAEGLQGRFDGPLYNAFPLIRQALLLNTPAPAPARRFDIGGARLGAIIGLLTALALIVGWPLSLAEAARLSALALLAGLAVECALRLLLPRHGGHYVYPPWTHLTFVTDEAATPGVKGGGRFLTNSLGLRSDEPPADRDFTIYVFGGSTVVDYYLDQDDCWTQRLQTKLNAYPGMPKVWVGNLGRPGIFSVHNQLIFDHALPDLPRADLFINLIGLNDMYASIGCGSACKLTPEDHLRWAFGDRPAGDVWWRQFYLVRAARLIDLRLRKWRRNGPEKSVSGSGLFDLRRFRAQTPPERRVDVLPELNEALAVYRGRLRRLISRANGYGAPMFFATSPTLWSADPPPEVERMLLSGGIGPNWAWEDGPLYFTAGALEAALERFNQATIETAARFSAPCVDVAKFMPKEPKYFYDDVHFTAAGSEFLAELMATRLAPLILSARRS